MLGGARPGRQWSKSVPLYSVMRGAMSRIIDYQRVELHTVSEVAVVGSAVEPLIHALSELLDNATRYSPPQTRVHLTAVDVQSGIAIEIEDGGVSMSEEARQRAERMLRQAQQGIDVNDLGETPAWASRWSAGWRRRTASRSRCARPPTAACVPSSSCRRT
uniref:ATP-binding protein n=1 Tax=Streptomyces zhihengii TaxID=1818004 RepID=UPI003556A2E8